IATDCKQHRTKLSLYESQIEQYLSQVEFPTDYQQILLAAYSREDEEGLGFDKQRASIENRLKNVKKLFEWGDLSDEEYHVQRDQLRNELAALPPATNDRKGMIERLAAYLQDVGKAWRDATQEQRNRLVKTLFESIRVEDGRIR